MRATVGSFKCAPGLIVSVSMSLPLVGTGGAEIAVIFTISIFLPRSLQSVQTNRLAGTLASALLDRDDF
jgi:hypothetical protein